MQNKKYLSMLGLARRAGRLSMGHDVALDAVKSRKAKLLVFASDISPRLIEEFSNYTDRFCPELLSVQLEETISQLHSALGYKAGVMTVDDINFSGRIIELINQEESVYGNKD